MRSILRWAGACAWMTLSLGGCATKSPCAERPSALPVDPALVALGAVPDGAVMCNAPMDEGNAVSFLVEVRAKDTAVGERLIAAAEAKGLKLTGNRSGETWELVFDRPGCHLQVLIGSRPGGLVAVDYHAHKACFPATGFPAGVSPVVR